MTTRNATTDGGIETTTMKAILHERYGAPADALRFDGTTRPEPGDNEVLVAVEAVGLAVGDWLITQGLPRIARPMYGIAKPKERVAGLEMAGTVAAVGDDVARFKEGDQVFGWGNGALAEYAAVSADTLMLKPANVTMEQAAAMPISGFTALQALRDAGRIEAGQEVLIVGASGAVGTFAVQIAKALGATVTGVASTRNVELVRSLGADHVVDYTRHDFTEDTKQYDLILDMAGNRPLSRIRGALATKGTLVIVGGSGGKWLMGFGRTIRAMVLSPFVGHQLRSLISKPNQDDLAILAGMAEAGDVAPVIDRTYPIAATAKALDHIGERHTQGKTVITV